MVEPVVYIIKQIVYVHDCTWLNNYCASVVKNAVYVREMFKQVVYKIEQVVDMIKKMVCMVEQVGEHS